MWVVFNELGKDGRWFFGMFNTFDRARDVANNMNEYNQDDTTVNYHICPLNDVLDMNIQNLPDYVIKELNKTNSPET